MSWFGGGTKAKARPSEPPSQPKNRVLPKNAPVGADSAPAAMAGDSLLRSSPKGPVDSVLAALVIALIGFGVVMVYSASAIEATVRHHDAQFFLKRQAVYALLALLTMWGVSRFDYRKLKPLTYPILVTVTGMLVACVAGLGHRAGNAYRWLSLGPIHIQPAEMAKLGIV